ncbi:hypothetical protein ACWFR5_26060 [Streptomyces sp. NPDC055092]|uniref:hypothetical protein n=1 Tax=Streptomyces sp. NPDC127172 TaxID=3345382 RepID=UPI003629449E
MAGKQPPSEAPAAGVELLRGRSGVVLAQHLIACLLILSAVLALPLGSYNVALRTLVIGGLARDIWRSILTVRDLRVRR